MNGKMTVCNRLAGSWAGWRALACAH